MNNMYIKFMNIFRIIFVAMYMIVLSAFAFTFLNKLIYSKDYATLFDYTYFPIYDNGMSPKYNEGDIAIVSLTNVACTCYNIKNNNYKVGDIICYKYGNKYIVKKIDSIDGIEYRMVGTNDNIVHNIELGAIVGKSTTSLKSMYKIFKIMINPFVIISILLYSYALTIINKG